MSVGEKAVAPRDNGAINPLPGERVGYRYVDTGNPYANGALYSLIWLYRTPMSYRVCFKLRTFKAG